jgi:3-methylfumaryl-CoA hydratase
MSGGTLATDYVGRREQAVATAHPEPLLRLAALLDADCPLHAGAPVPPGWHWAYFLPTTPQSRLGADGHPVQGEFLPHLPGRRRMWAGSRLVFDGQLRIGDQLRRRSEILAVEVKRGRSGPFMLICLEHRIASAGGASIVETQDLVFRQPAEPAAAGATEAADPPPLAEFRRIVEPDPTLLFRFSAVTFNAHRIHYDERYATAVEGYPGLVVQGPLQAILMLDLLRREHPRRPVAAFSFRAERPAFASAQLSICGRAAGTRIDLWVESADRVVSRATIETSRT